MDWADETPSSLHTNILSEVVEVHRSDPKSSPLVFINLSNSRNFKPSTAHNKGFMSRWAVLNSSRNRRYDDDSSPSGTASRSPTPVETLKEVKPRSRRKHVVGASLLPLLASPIERVGVANKDPFESLPLKIDNPTWQLLNYWLDARGWDLMQEDYRHQVATIRKKICFPLISSSSVTLAAAITLIEQTVHPSTSRPAIVARLSQALQELHKSLADLDYIKGPQIMLSAVLLMNVAANLRDFDALRAHFCGVAALLSRQPKLHTENHFTRGLLNAWAFSYVNAEGHFSLPDFLQFDASACAVKAEPSAGTALRKLHQQGFLLNNFYNSLPDLILVRPLLDLAVTDRLSPTIAEDMLRCIWTGCLGLACAVRKCTTRIEKCCWYALTLNFLSELDHGPVEKLVGLSGLIYLQLKRLDIDHALSEIPEFILWVALTAISLLENRIGVLWLLQIVNKSSAALSINQYSEAKLICETFVWSPHVDKHASLLYPDEQSGGCSLRNRGPELEHVDAIDVIQADLNSGTASPVSGPCTLCMRQDCPCPLTKGDDGELNNRMKNHVGMIWGNVAEFRKMCDQPWIDNDSEYPPSSHSMTTTPTVDNGR